MKLNPSMISTKNVFYLSSALMLVLAFLNPGAANDNHFTVIEVIIAMSNKFPVSTQCHQCYHPKLYHFLVAQIWNLFGIQTVFWKQFSAQIINAGFGICTIHVIRRYIDQLSFDKNIRILVYAFIALNPRLISIFGEATNDALIIFFGNLAIFSTLKLFKQVTLKYTLFTIASVVLGCMTKLNFGIYFIAIIITLGTLIFIKKNYSLSFKKGYLGTIVIMLFLTLFVSLFFNGYYESIKTNGTPFTYNTPMSSLPHLYKRSEYLPGIQSIYSGYFKFHYFELIKYPRIEIRPGLIVNHQSELFSSLYGRWNFLYYDHWPVEWQNSDKTILMVGSISLAMAIVPTILLFLGLFLMLKSLYSSIKNKNWKELFSNEYWVILLFLAGYIGFSVLFSMLGKLFTFMKAIYIFPGMLAVVIPLCLGYTFILKYLKTQSLKTAFYAYNVILILIYLIPVFHLFFKLYKDRFGG